MLCQRLENLDGLPPLPAERAAFQFRFNGRAITARQGDTVSAALLAAGHTILSRSFKYHRPRGYHDGWGHGSETLLQIDGQPNVAGDTTLAKPGMVVESQNAFPSLKFDWAAVNNWLVRLLPVGFYYKMFHWPKGAWRYFEKPIRRMAGIGAIRQDSQAHERRYEKRYRFPDVCIIGGGPAGLAAALSAAKTSASVLLIDDQPSLGGHSRHSIRLIDGQPEWQRVQELAQQVQEQEKIECLVGATAFSVYEDNLVAAQKDCDLFKIRAQKVILATGASDRPYVFAGNDLPGVLQARGVERLIALHHLRPAATAVVITNNEAGYHAADLLRRAGTRVVAIADQRPAAEGARSPLYRAAIDHAVPVHFATDLVQAQGFGRVRSVTLSSHGNEWKIPTDLLVTAMGLTPQLNLLASGHSRPRWDEDRGTMVPTTLPRNLWAVGELHGPADFTTLVTEGANSGQAAAANHAQAEPPARTAQLVPKACSNARQGRQFVCKCMDVTVKEARLSMAEGFDQVETLKRYSSAGMGPCQGRGCFEAVARIASQFAPDKNPTVPATTMRPPFRPVSFGVLAGRAPHLGPIRRTPMHENHAKSGAKFLTAGLWLRPEHYGDPQQEALHVRNSMGMIDVSTLGKLRITGEDTDAFLHFMFPGKYRQLAPNRTRYVTMVGEDGILFEDGTLTCLAPNDYYLTTTTGNQDHIESLFWWWITTEGFRVQIRNLGAVYGAVNIAGPMSREFLSTQVETDLSTESFPYMAHRATKLLGIPCHMFRIGFTGELGYEIHFLSEYGASLWEALINIGAPHLKPFGVEAQRILRLEKSHLIPGVDTDALSSPYDAGCAFTIKDDKPDFIGKAFLAHTKQRPGEERLIPYSLKPGDPIPEDGVSITVANELCGRVTSSRRSPTLERGIGLAWIKTEHSQPGKRFQIRLSDGQTVPATVLASPPFDPDGERVKS